MYLIDFPGMFDTSGQEVGVIIDLALKMIVQEANSTKIALVIPANHTKPEQQHFIQTIQDKLKFMITDP